MKQRFLFYASRQEFALVYLLNFILLAYVVAWLLIAGPSSKHQLVSRIGGALRFVLGLSFLQLLGRHSLLVYAWHVVLIYIIVWSNLAVGPFGWIARTAIAICGIALLALPAVYGEGYGSWGRLRAGGGLTLRPVGASAADRGKAGAPAHSD